MYCNSPDVRQALHAANMQGSGRQGSMLARCKGLEMVIGLRAGYYSSPEVRQAVHAASKEEPGRLGRRNIQSWVQRQYLAVVIAAVRAGVKV